MKAKIIWGLLVVYTLIHLIWFRTLNVNLMALSSFQGEPLAVGVFNLMGLFPIVFIAFLLGEPKKPTWPKMIAHVLGFGVGAFALLPVVSFAKQRPRRLTSVFRIMLMMLSLVALALLIWMVLKGSTDAYLGLVESDSFIHIMTIDFMVLYAMSVIVSRQRFKVWPLVLIPVAGALLVLSTSKEHTR